MNVFARSPCCFTLNCVCVCVCFYEACILSNIYYHKQFHDPTSSGASVAPALQFRPSAMSLISENQEVYGSGDSQWHNANTEFREIRLIKTLKCRGCTGAYNGPHTPSSVFFRLLEYAKNVPWARPCLSLAPFTTLVKKWPQKTMLQRPWIPQAYAIPSLALLTSMQKQHTTRKISPSFVGGVPAAALEGRGSDCA
jgi:hypothetical protein